MLGQLQHKSQKPPWSVNIKGRLLLFGLSGTSARTLRIPPKLRGNAFLNRGFKGWGGIQ